jgi:hypothetical protein
MERATVLLSGRLSIVNSSSECCDGRLLNLIPVGQFLGLELKQIIVQLIESLFPDAAERLQPCIQLLKRLGPKSIYPPVSDRMHLYEPGIAEHAEMFGHLRLMQPKPIGDLSYWAGTVTQQFNDV